METYEELTAKINELERMEDALLDLKNTISRDVGAGLIPLAEYTVEWVQGIDQKLAETTAIRDVLRFNAGISVGKVPPAYGDHKPDLDQRAECMRQQNLSEALVNADRKIWETKLSGAR